MKKLLIFPFLLLLAVHVDAQRGRNGYYGGGGNAGVNEYHGGRNGNVYRQGRQGRQVHGRNVYRRGGRSWSGTTVRGNVRRGAVRRGGFRTVYRPHNRAGYRWRVNQRRVWIPGQYVWMNGCEVWQPGYYDWVLVDRVCVPW